LSISLDNLCEARTCICCITEMPTGPLVLYYEGTISPASSII
jgi:hypothetical protein